MSSCARARVSRLLCLAFGAAPFLTSAPALADDESRWFVWPGASGGIVAEPNAIGGGPQLGLTFRPWSFLEPEIVVGTGGFAGTNDFTHRFSFGSRLVLPSQTLQPFLWMAFTHFHEAPLALLVEKPVETMLSLSDVGVAHRSGAEAGLGLVLPIAVQPWEGGQPMRVLLRGTAMFLPDFASFADEKGGRPSHLYLLFEVGIGLPLSFDPGALREPRVHTPFRSSS